MYIERAARNEYSAQDLVAIWRNEDKETYVGEHTIAELHELYRKSQERSVFKNVGKWRGAWNIHNWFVGHLQYGRDTWSPKELQKEQLELLLSECIADVSTGGLFCFGGANKDQAHDWYQIACTIVILPEVLNMDWKANRFFFGPRGEELEVPYIQ